MIMPVFQLFVNKALTCQSCNWGTEYFTKTVVTKTLRTFKGKEENTLKYITESGSVMWFALPACNPERTVSLVLSLLGPTGVSDAGCTMNQSENTVYVISPTSNAYLCSMCPNVVSALSRSFNVWLIHAYFYDTLYSFILHFHN